VTLLLLDLASYQQGVDLSLPAYDAWGLVNIKTSQGNWYVADRTGRGSGPTRPGEGKG
jgi:hypothetical protein